MKTRIAAAIATLFMASLGTAAYAQSQSTMPQQTTPPASSQGMNKNPSMSDQRVERKIKRELKAHGVKATHVTVAFQDGTATLTGTVASKREIKKAKAAAMRVHGVNQVDASGLQAQGQAGQQ